jgi:hypothetical protein
MRLFVADADELFVADADELFVADADELFVAEAHALFAKFTYGRCSRELAMKMSQFFWREISVAHGSKRLLAKQTR